MPPTAEGLDFLEEFAKYLKSKLDPAKNPQVDEVVHQAAFRRFMVSLGGKPEQPTFKVLVQRMSHMKDVRGPDAITP